MTSCGLRVMIGPLTFPMCVVAGGMELSACRTEKMSTTSFRSPLGRYPMTTAFPTCDPTRSHISPSITKLPYLRTLFFYRCFSYNPQPIPSLLGQLGATLQTLVLRENGHVGPIPIELGNLTRLKVLDLHKNNLNGSIPVSLGRMTGLRSLDLSGNKLTSIPNFSFPILSIFDLSQNLLMGSIPSSIGACHALIKMDLGHNQLTGPVT
ncbi:hypothetical protein GBA52_009951 [Prunus armeniaca]|nr:hypothetical protein GBA52_009951 [Prunus armeniaca]